MHLIIASVTARQLKSGNRLGRSARKGNYATGRVMLKFVHILHKQRPIATRDKPVDLVWMKFGCHGTESVSCFARSPAREAIACMVLVDLQTIDVPETLGEQYCL